jgi:hypothetical protein
MNGSRTSNGRFRPFSLLANPFHILCVDPGATTQQVQRAFDRALEKQLIAADILVLARDVALDPLRRLPHELGYLLDSPLADIETLYIELAADASLDSRLGFASRLPPLSRANFLGHLAAHQPASEPLLSGLLDAHASIDVSTIFDILKRLRASAGYFAPSLVSINQGLIDLFNSHAQSAIARYELIQSAAVPVSVCTEKMLARGGRHHIEALERFLAQYRNSLVSQHSAAIESIKDTCETLLRQPSDVQSLERLKATLLSWVIICRPLILLDLHQRRSDPKLELAVGQLRATIVNLTGRDQHDVALNLAEFGRDVFRIMPKTAEQFDHDAGVIAGLRLEAKARSLRAYIDGLGDDLSPLARSLVATGFGQNSAGQCEVLWGLFVEATDARIVRPSTEPWTMVRQLAIHLRDQAEHEAASHLLRGLIAQGVKTSVTPDILATLRDDLGVIDPDKNLDPQAQTEAKLHPHGLASSVRRRARFVRQSGLALVIVLCAVAINFDFDMLWPHASPKAVVEPLPENAEPEIMPPVGAGQHLELGGVRYCKFQETRLLMMKREVHGSEDSRAFNRLAEDYNSRCANFFYRDRDLATVKAEMAKNSPRLAAEAQRMVSTWPSHSLPTVPSAK